MESQPLARTAPSRAHVKSKSIEPRTLLLLTGVYWVYVTLSNVLYAHNMQIGITQQIHQDFFAPASVRVLQHAFLFPVLLMCYWASSRVGWATRRGLSLQMGLALIVPALSFPLLGWAYVTLDVATWPMRPAAMSEPEQSYWALWSASFVNFLLTYSFGAALIAGFVLYQRYRDSELRGAALEQGWTRARLSALRMQLSPHTLFNLLHTIRGQINPEPEIARSMVVQLADLLRRLLSAGQRDFSLLSEELTFVRLYLELQRERFSDRLTIELPDAAAPPRLWVPSLILQPLVENAVIHGLSGHDGPVTIRIEVTPAAETLTIRIVNTTGGARQVSTEGIGLDNVRERLAVQFGAQATLRTAAADSTSWLAEITMPALRELSGDWVGAATGAA
jgi:sensor histidine kinase YesM